MLARRCLILALVLIVFTPIHKIYAGENYSSKIIPNVYSDIVIEKPKFLSIINSEEKFDYTDLDFFCLAKNIFHEAGGESQLGKYAVAQVTLNRLKNSRYPNSICDVVMEPYQFSWTLDAEKQWSVPEGIGWEHSKKIAYAVLKGKRIYGMDKTLYFHNNTIVPVWAHTKHKITQIGGHIFYNPKS